MQGVEDPARDVRWNAAVSLARLGSDAGYDLLLQMADRKTLESYELPEDKIEEIMTSAIKTLNLLEKKETMEIFQSLGSEDKSLKVRQAALEILKS